MIKSATINGVTRKKSKSSSYTKNYIESILQCSSRRYTAYSRKLFQNNFIAKTNTVIKISQSRPKICMFYYASCSLIHIYLRQWIAIISLIRSAAITVENIFNFCSVNLLIKILINNSIWLRELTKMKTVH